MGLSPSNRCIDLIKQFEGCHLIRDDGRIESYADIVGVWTIGYGHTRDVYPGMIITKDEAEDLLREDLGDCEAYIKDLVKVKITQTMYDSLCSFIFNVGGFAFQNSTLLKKLNKGDYKGASYELLRWNKAGGNVLAGLTRRRKAEKKMFDENIDSLA